MVLHSFGTCRRPSSLRPCAVSGGWRARHLVDRNEAGRPRRRVSARATSFHDSISQPAESDAQVVLNDTASDGGVRYSSSSEALFNCLNVLLGCGVLTIPYALKEGGWAAFGVLAVMGLATNYTGKKLIECQEFYNLHADAAPASGSSIHVKEGLMQTYEDIAEAAFGKRGREFMTAVLYTELIGTCALFLILQRDHARLLFEALPGMSLPSDEMLLALAFAVVLPTTWLPDLAALSYVGAAGFWSAVTITGLLVYLSVTSHTGIIPGPLVDWHSLPVTFGLLAFVFAGHAVFPTIYAGLHPKERAEFPQILDKSYLVVLTVCAIVGACGFLTFGSSTMEEVTLNVPPGAIQLATTALVLVSPFAKFAITLEPVAQGLDGQLGISKASGPMGMLKANVLRTGLACSALILATEVPFFGAFMSILGSFLTLTVSVLFPAAAHYKMHESELSVKDKATDAVVFGLGAVTTVVGTCTAVQALCEASANASNAAVQHSSIATPLVSMFQTTTDVATFHSVVCQSLCHMV